jgi:hypothetical protein
VSDKLSLANAVRKIEFKLLQLITKVGRRRIRRTASGKRLSLVSERIALD